MKGATGTALLLLMAAIATAAAVEESNKVVKSFSELPKAYPDMSMMLTYLKLQPDLASYLDNPNTVCTVIAPANSAIQYALKALGEYVGLFSQNKTLQETLMNYHVIPGMALTAAQLGKPPHTREATRANETVWFAARPGGPVAAYRKDLLVPIAVADVKSGKCLVHIIRDRPLVPPTLTPTLEGWVAEAGNLPKSLPKAEWIKDMTPLPGTIPPPPEAVAPLGSTPPPGAPAAAAGAGGAGAGTGAPAAPAAAKSGAAAAAAAANGGAMAAAAVLAGALMLLA